jgi:hypothetical protein
MLLVFCRKKQGNPTPGPSRNRAPAQGTQAGAHELLAVVQSGGFAAHSASLNARALSQLLVGRESEMVQTMQCCMRQIQHLV